jgi:nucleoside-diphosphate-sugar epimerase
LIGQLLLPHLAQSAAVRALDIRPIAQLGNVDVVRGSVADPSLVEDLVRDCTSVLHLATGSSRGWEGLLEVDIIGTRLVYDLAAATGVGRVIFASTNHVAGGVELDSALSRRPSEDSPTNAVRPDSPYGAAKAFGEAYGRFISESTNTSVSCLRLGSVRLESELLLGPGSEVTAPTQLGEYWPDELLTPTALRARLRRTWLSHADLFRIVDEELAARERFRLRWAVSDNPGRLWPLDVYTWDR